jgi:hypothetical protein
LSTILRKIWRNPHILLLEIATILFQNRYSQAEMARAASSGGCDTHSPGLILWPQQEQRVHIRNSLSLLAFGLALVAGAAHAQEAAAPPQGEGTQAALTPPMDCGEGTTVIGHAPPPLPTLPEDTSAMTEAEWAAYEELVRQRFGMAPRPEAETPEPAPAAPVKEVIGCALDDWQSDQAAPEGAEGPDVAVLATGMDVLRTKAARETADNDQSGKGASRTAAGRSTPSAKAREEEPEAEPMLKGMGPQLLAAGIIAAVLLALVKLTGRRVVSHLFRRRKCRIDAQLATGQFRIPGTVLVLGHKGCLFVADDYKLLDEVLDIPRFLEFSLVAAGQSHPVIINKTDSTSIAAYFNRPLLRDEQRQMLRQSTIATGFDGWRSQMTSRTDGMRSARARIARLRQLREEEELARRFSV